MEKKLIVIHPGKYHGIVLDIAIQLAHNHERMCYVTLNKTHGAVESDLESNGIKTDNIFFVDSVTPTVLKGKTHQNCLFLDIDQGLDTITEEILNFVKLNKVDCLFFDSFSSFLVYHTDNELVKFFNYLISFLEKLDVNITMTVLLDDVNRQSVKHIKMNVDDVVIEMSEPQKARLH